MHGRYVFDIRYHFDLHHQVTRYKVMIYIVYMHV